MVPVPGIVSASAAPAGAKGGEDQRMAVGLGLGLGAARAAAMSSSAFAAAMLAPLLSAGRSVHLPGRPASSQSCMAGFNLQMAH